MQTEEKMVGREEEEEGAEGGQAGVRSTPEGAGAGPSLGVSRWLCSPHLWEHLGLSSSHAGGLPEPGPPHLGHALAYH